MGITVEITNVDKQANTISFSQNGQARSCGIVAPAKVQWAKNGKAEIGFNQEGNVNFIKSLEPKAVPQSNYNRQNSYQNQNQPQERKFKALNLVEVLKGLTLDEFKIAYNELSNKPNAKVNATNFLNARTEDEKFLVDCVFFYTRFDKIPLVDKDDEEDVGVNEDGTI
jgi:hypothetical protein